MSDTEIDKRRITIDIEAGMLPELMTDLAPFMATHAGVEIRLNDAPTQVFNPGFVEWVEADDAREPVAVVTIDMLSEFARHSQGNPNLGNRLRHYLNSPGSPRSGLEPYTVFSPDKKTALGFRADRLGLLWERLRVHELYVRQVGGGAIGLLNEYCQAMTAKPAEPTR